MDLEGGLVPGQTAGLSKDDLLKIYRIMVLTRTADETALTLQRQGRIGPYVPCVGHEAAHIGSAFALEPQDWIFPHYRSQAAAFTRGLSMLTFFSELFGTKNDLAQGHGMPNTLGDRKINYVTLSAPVGAMLPHAVGVGLAARLRKEQTVALGYFGEGASSSNDFHTAMNFAGVFKTQTIFFCHNNQYAISVPLKRQTAAESIAIKAEAYGLSGVRVDGNDILAVYRATKDAVERARSGGGPTLIEALTYRLGPHSSVDDPTRYRSRDEVEEWRRRDPIERFKRFLEKNKILNERLDSEIHAAARREVDEAVKVAEATAPPELVTLIENVYSELPSSLIEQHQELAESVDKRE
jgi:pyruvate dehydrogenase E1 component alpha subunit